MNHAELGVPSIRAQVHTYLLKFWFKYSETSSNLFSKLSFESMWKRGTTWFTANNIRARHSIPDDFLRTQSEGFTLHV